MSKNRNKGRHDNRSAQGGAPVPGRTVAATSPAGFAALREGPEPTAGDAAVPVLMIALLGLLVYLADVLVNNRGGHFDQRVYYPFGSLDDVIAAHPSDPASRLRNVGKQVYNQIGCVSCHMGNGMGQAGTFPPLAGSDWVLAPSPNRIIRIVLNGAAGPIEVSGNQFNNTMVPWKDTLDDEKIAAVLTYIRSEWGNKAPGVTPDQVKKIRAKVQDRDQPWSPDDLKKISDDE